MRSYSHTPMYSVVNIWSTCTTKVFVIQRLSFFLSLINLNIIVVFEWSVASPFVAMMAAGRRRRIDAPRQRSVRAADVHFVSEIRSNWHMRILAAFVVGLHHVRVGFLQFPVVIARLSNFCMDISEIWMSIEQSCIDNQIFNDITMIKLTVCR